MSAVVTGIDTVLADDPQLNVRDGGIDLLGRQPLRVVLDSKLRMSPQARMLAQSGDTLIFTADDRVSHGKALQAQGAEVAGVALDATGRLDLQVVLRELGRRLCNDVLIEAGPTLAGRCIETGLADEVLVYLAPLVLGSSAKAMLRMPALQRLADAPRFRLQQCEQVGDDLKLRYLPIHQS